MKKVLSLVIMATLSLNTVAFAAPLDNGVDGEGMKNKPKKMETIEKLKNKSEKTGKNFDIKWDEEKDIPSFITGALSDKNIDSSSDAANFVSENKAMFELNVGEFVNKSTESDQLNKKHYKNKLVVDNIPVFGAEVVVHTEADGTVYAINGNVEKEVPEKSWSKEFKLSGDKAIKNVLKELNIKETDIEYSAEPTAEQYIYNDNGNWVPIYYVTTQFMVPYHGNVVTLVNANTGEVIKTRNEIQSATATGTGAGLLGTRNLNLDLLSGRYYMRDLTKGAKIETYDANRTATFPGTLVSDVDNNFNASTQLDAVDVHANVAVTYDFYKNNFNRNSYDNLGTTIKSTVNGRDPSNPSQPMDNAFWNGTQMVFGDCSGTTFAHIGSSLDVVGHEFTHAITDKTAGLEYENQSGALNESFSDVFGYLIEGQASDWLMGEDCYTPSVSGDALRSLSDPTLYDQPAHMNQYQNLPNTSNGDWGGVHINSGIPNKAFYLAATSINNNAKLSQVYYRALTVYLTQFSQFTDAKNALVQAANDLYPSEPTIATKISDAFTSVGIGATSQSDTYEPNNTMSAAVGVLANGTTYSSYIYSSSDLDYYYFNATAGRTITVSLTNLPKDYDVYLINSAGTIVARSENGSTTSESISYYTSTSGKYYVKVSGYAGAYSTTTPYKLRVTY
ncbi:M4 family metallopeptidase [Clostridium sp.]|uniref:M4 family metallopeptidase n=1 Tax=Clostridium sp. TaxID=1506 RepID=UPI002FC93C1C